MVQILVVEDNFLNQKLIVNQLKALEYEYHVVSNGKAALNLLGKIDYDLVLMDLQLPSVDGYQTTKMIRESQRNADVTIVAITALSIEEEAQKCLDVGMNDYLQKPYSIDALKQMLQTWL